MSTQAGPIRLKGKLGGISFFQREGQYMARMANGPDKKRIKNDPNFERTRENNSEFGGSSTAAKSFRLALASMRHMADGRFSSRLTGIFKAITAHGDGPLGKRPIRLSENRVQLVNLEFNINRSVTSLFTGLFTASNAEDRTRASVTIERVMMSRAVKAPEGATHVVFIQSLAVLSDYVYHEPKKGYVPIDEELHEQNETTFSGYIPLKGDNPVSITLETILPGAPVLNENVSVVQCFGVAFYKRVNEEYYPMVQAHAMKVIRVF